MLQARNWLPRAEGTVVLGVGAQGLEVLRQAGPARVRFPRPSAGGLEAVLVNTAGGLTGGDRIAISVALSGPAPCLVTTAAAEKVYRARDLEPAVVAVSLALEGPAHLAWLPQPTILFDGARLKRSTEVALADGATLLALEILIFGRSAMGERVRVGAISDAWRVRRDGTLKFADTFRLSGAVGEALARKATLDGARASAFLLYAATDATARLAEVQARVAGIGAAAGASAWDGLLVVRALADDGGLLQRQMGALAAWLGRRPLPRMWDA